uniref:Sp185/333 n=1 Tax=Strongylocentrotus purpuratus TaxID=7668 RepID=Q3LS77_STRPU|nr:185/333 [Strongylocentrotus purpuratus]
MVKVTLIVAIVAALAISAHAQRDYNELRGNKNGRERGQGRFGGRPGGMQMGGSRQDGGPMGGRRFDGPDSGAPQMDGRRQDGGPMGEEVRWTWIWCPGDGWTETKWRSDGW